MTRLKAFAKYSFIFLLFLFVVDSIWIEPNRLVIHQETLILPHWPQTLSGLRIGVISDIHTGAPFITLEKVKTIVRKMNALHPDLVLYPGDYVEGVLGGHRVLPEVTASLLKEVKSPLGNVSVLGNHDWWYDGDRVAQALRKAHFVVLENDSVKLTFHDTSFWIVGLADSWTRDPDIVKALSGIPAGSPVIAMGHNPRVIRHMPDWVALTVAGHTHGGQVNFPLIGSPMLLLRGLWQYRAGYMLDKGRPLFVSTGIGTSILPLRFNVPPEIELITLKSQN